MPGKELRDDLSEEEIEEKRKRTIKTTMHLSMGGGRNKEKSHQKEGGVKRTAEQRAGRRRRTGLDCDEDNPTHGFD